MCNDCACNATLYLVKNSESSAKGVLRTGFRGKDVLLSSIVQCERHREDAMSNYYKGITLNFTSFLVKNSENSTKGLLRTSFRGKDVLISSVVQWELCERHRENAMSNLYKGITLNFI